MGLHLDDRWLWDFWLARSEGMWHVFFLHAPQTPDDPDQRHHAAVVGHAVSENLRSWNLLPDVITCGAAGSWDDASTWTGSVVSDPAGGWTMLYTGTSRRERSLVQRIGVARSPDLVEWTKYHANPVLETDPRWYETLDLDVWFDQAWRDPYLVRDSETGLFHAFLTARSVVEPPPQRGVIGHANSPDLTNWTVTRPIEAPQGFGYMELPQVMQLGSHWHLLFSAPGWAQSARPKPHCTGTFHAVADRITGPYVEREPLFCDQQESLYGGKLIIDDGRLWCLAFRYRDEAGGLVGQLTDPMPVSLTDTDDLLLERTT